MMDPSSVALQSASQTSNASNPPLSGSILQTLPLTGAVAPSFNNAIALQQFQFQQSLMNQQLVAQQQAVAHAVSIKAAAERAAARAAEISMLLNSETKVVQISEDVVVEREKTGLKSPSRSASPPQSSKPGTKSPIRCRNGRREPEEHSPRDHSGYGSRRNSSSYSRDNDLRGYSRSSYRRGENYSGSRSSFNRSSNTSWRRRRSPLSRSRYCRGGSRSPRRHVGSRSPRHHVGSRSPRRHVGSRSPRHHFGSRSPRRHHIRSPSPISRQQTSSRASNRHRICKSPTKGGSSSTCPPHAGKASPRKATARRSLSASDNSPIQNTANLLLMEKNDADAVNTSENNISSNLNAMGQDRDAERSCGKKNLVSGRCNSDHFGETNSQEPALKKTVAREFATAITKHSDSDSTQGLSVRRGLGLRDGENDSETSVPPRYADQINLPTEMLDCCSDRNDIDTENRNGDFSMSNGKGKKSCDSATENGIEEGHRKPLSSFKPEGDLSDHGQRNYSHKGEEKMYVNKEQVMSRKRISSKEADSGNISGECAIYPLPEGHESTGMKVDFTSPVMVPDVDPNVSKHRKKRHRRRSTSRDRRTKHRRSHHKKHRGESEEGEIITDRKRESHEKRKMERREKKGRNQNH